MALMLSILGSLCEMNFVLLSHFEDTLYVLYTVCKNMG